MNNANSFFFAEKGNMIIFCGKPRTMCPTPDSSEASSTAFMKGGLGTRDH